MSGNDTTLSCELGRDVPSRADPQPVWALCVIYCQENPARVGEVILVPSGRPGTLCVIGRGDGLPDDGRPRLEPSQQRPGVLLPAPPWTSRRISRVQLEVRALDDECLEVRNVGKARLLHNGSPVDSARVTAGGTIQVGQQLLFLCLRRPSWLPAPTHAIVEPPFGRPDADGLVGESPALWQLRERIAFVAARNEHVLIQGESGTGKEIVARAIHARSLRNREPLICRNAATLPPGIIDAELFGNARNYPNAGMAERNGLIGEAHRGTLYLDEFGELPAGLSAHLLRVLDAGEYQRLGETRLRCSEFRLVAATNRPTSAIKDDVAARLKLHINVPPLESRREDIPLLACHLLRRVASADPAAAARFFPGNDLDAPPRLSIRLIRKLVQHQYRTHVRELESMLWESMAASTGDELDWPSDAAGDDAAPARAPTGSEFAPATTESLPPPVPTTVSTHELRPEAIQRCLDEHHGIIELTWPALGLRSRHALVRLIIKHGLRAGRNWP